MCYLQLLPPGKPRRSQSGASLCCTSVFQPQCYGCFEWNNYLFWRAVLYIEGCVATSLASTHYMSAARLSPLWGNQKRLQSLLSVLWGVKSALAESPFRSIEQHEAGAEFSPGSLGGKLALGPRGESLSSQLYHPSTLWRAIWGPWSQPREDSSQRGGERGPRARSKASRPSESVCVSLPHLANGQRVSSTHRTKCGFSSTRHKEPPTVFRLCALSPKAVTSEGSACMLFVSYRRRVLIWSCVLECWVWSRPSLLPDMGPKAMSFEDFCPHVHKMKISDYICKEKTSYCPHWPPHTPSLENRTANKVVYGSYLF